MEPTPQPSAIVQHLHALADVASEAILPHFRAPVDVENKAQTSGFDPVTVADRAAETAMRTYLKQNWPAHGINGEEFPNVNTSAKHQWVLDPIDGTRGFIIGLPVWGTLIGFKADGKTLAGMMAQPHTGDRFWSDGKVSMMRSGHTGDPQPMKTRPCPALSAAIITTSHPEHFKRDDERAAFDDLATHARMSRFGGDCYQYCMVAAGLIDAVIETGLAAYDIAALVPIVENAGGCISTWSGQPAGDGGQVIATGDRALHEALLQRLAPLADA